MGLGAIGGAPGSPFGTESEPVEIPRDPLGTEGLVGQPP